MHIRDFRPRVRARKNSKAKPAAVNHQAAGSGVFGTKKLVPSVPGPSPPPSNPAAVDVSETYACPLRISEMSLAERGPKVCGDGTIDPVVCPAKGPKLKVKITLSRLFSTAA